MPNVYADCAKHVLDAIAEDYPGAKVLHQAEDWQGTVCTVFETADGVRWYWADEFTDDAVGLPDGSLEHHVVLCCGRHTTERACYIGQRYASKALWGRFFAEVFTFCGTRAPATIDGERP